MNYRKLLLVTAVVSAGMAWITDLNAAENAGPNKKRIAIFSEAGFPNKSPRSAAWYEKTLKDAGCEVTAIGVKELCDAKAVNKGRYDTLIVATGGYLPVDAEETIGRFMMEGGTILMDENMMISRWTRPEDVEKEYSTLKEKYLKSEGIEEYRDFEYQQGLPGKSMLFRFSKELGRWMIPVGYFYYQGMGARTQMGEFELLSWPHHNNPDQNYRRVFDEDLNLNPILKGNGLPELLPVEITTEGGEKIKAGDSDKFSLVRLQMLGGSGHNVLPPWEYANDVLIPVYLFKKVSGRKYPAFEKAGNDAKDKESDFYIYRAHGARKNGFTLVHFGVVGAHLLKSEKGAEVLKATLKLAEVALPGERKAEYIEDFNRLDKALSRYTGASIGMMELWMKLAKAYHYAGRVEKEEEITNRQNDERETFEEIAERGEWFKRESLTAGGGGTEMKELIEKCGQLSASLEKELAAGEKELIKMADFPKAGNVTNRFERMSLGFMDITPDGLLRLRDVYPILKDLGVSSGPMYFSNIGSAETLKELYEMTGIFTGYRMNVLSSTHPAKREWDMGVLDPEKGTVATKKWQWYETGDDWKFFEKDAAWFLKKVNEMPGIGYVCYLDERDLAWSMWDERMRLRFIKYLSGKYQTVEKMNEKWRSGFKTFDEIKLPLKRPETREEHALWEDWTRYREIYYLEEEVRPQARIVRKYAPRLFSLVYGSYSRQPLNPANGINYYEIYKEFNPNTFEMGPHLRNEIIAADIAGHHHRNLTAEWAAYYYPPPTQGEKIDLFKQEVWKGAGWGQLGICMFLGSMAGNHKSNLISVNDTILPLGWQMKAVMEDMTLMRAVTMDGRRENPAVRILYSPTTRRHTSWPGIERDKSMEEVCGWYRAMQMAHIPARAIDEGAVLEEGISPDCAALILPQVEYLTDALREKIEKYVKAGGALVITEDSGRYNEYGDKKSSLLELAGVVNAGTAGDGAVDLGGGRFMSAEFKGGRAEILKALYPETEEVLKYRKGGAAVTAGTYGKGRIVVTGVPFGQWFNNELEGNPGEALAYAAKIMEATGVPREFECDDTNVTIWPWEYAGKRYLLITSRTRSGLTKARKTGGFPFERMGRMEAFTLKVAGDYKIKDYLLGMTVPVKREGDYTVISGLVPSPGGVLYELEGTRRTILTKEGEQVKTTLEAEKKGDAVAKKEYSLPYEGRIFESEGELKVGSYRMNLETKTAGQWSGDVYMSLESQSGEKIKQKCTARETAEYRFLGKTVKVECREVTGAMPVNVLCRIWEEEAKTANIVCKLKEEMFHGQKSIVLENEYVRARILPEIGGRVVELITLSDGINHLSCNPEAIERGVGGTWADYGGLELNPGAHPGPFWGYAFEWEIVTNSANEAKVVLKKSKTFKWSEGNRGNGESALEQTYGIKQGKAALEVKYRLFNGREGGDILRMGTHPAMAAGGTAGGADAFYYPLKGGWVKELPYLAGRGVPFWKNEGGWIAVIDRERMKGLAQIFNEKDVAELYAYMGANAYNFELRTVEHQTPKGECMTWEYELGCLQGIRGLCGFDNGIGINIDLPGEIYGNNEETTLGIQAASLENRKAELTLGIEGPASTTIKSWPAVIRPDQPVNEKIKWNTGVNPDGEYALVVSVKDGAGRELAKGKRKLIIAGQSRARWQKELKGLKAEWEKTNERLLKNGHAQYEGEKPRLTRIAILLSEMEEKINRNEVNALANLKEEIERDLSEVK